MESHDWCAPSKLANAKRDPSGDHAKPCWPSKSSAYRDTSLPSMSTMRRVATPSFDWRIAMRSPAGDHVGSSKDRLGSEMSVCVSPVWTSMIEIDVGDDRYTIRVPSGDHESPLFTIG